MDGVKYLGEGVYMVKGKLIQAHDRGMFSGEEGRKTLLSMVEHSLVRHKPFSEAGWSTYVPIVAFAGPNRPGGRYETAGMSRASKLPESVKSALRSEFPDLDL